MDYSNKSLYHWAIGNESASFTIGVLSVKATRIGEHQSSYLTYHIEDPCRQNFRVRHNRLIGTDILEFVRVVDQKDRDGFSPNFVKAAVDRVSWTALLKDADRDKPISAHLLLRHDLIEDYYSFSHIDLGTSSSAMYGNLQVYTTTFVVLSECELIHRNVLPQGDSTKTITNDTNRFTDLFDEEE
jgi:hypothetical protein